MTDDRFRTEAAPPVRTTLLELRWRVTGDGYGFAGLEAVEAGG